MRIYIVCLVGLLMIGPSCKKFVETPQPKNQVQSSAVFADSVNATSAILGVYINIMSTSTSFNMIHGGLTVYTGLTSDELISNRTATFPEELQLYTNTIVNTNSITGSMWLTPYPWIYQINADIEGITASTGISVSCKNQLTGEAKFLRALIYFNLVNLFGDVPLVTTTDYRVNAQMPRTPVSQVYDQIVSDLQDAQQLLPTTYPSAGRVRANQYSADALLARVYLYQKQWAKSEAAATHIISSGSYSLPTTLNSVFLAGSSEAILQFIPLQSGAETSEGKNFIPGTTTTVPIFSISNFLLNAFESNDARKTNWLAKNTVTIAGVPTVYYYPFKYQFGQDGLAVPKNNYMILRLAEQYLIRAEARAQQGNLAGALLDLNTIRNRAGLPSSTATLQGDILTAIYHERQVELFLELGQRWFDLKRTGLVNAVMPAITTAKGGSWNANWQLFPVPAAQLQVNPFLTQNSGY